jgi:hypothetical protein
MGYALYASGGLAIQQAQARERISLADPLGEGPKEVRNAVRVVADERPIPRKDSIPVSGSHQYPPHPKHSPRSVESLLYGSIVADHPSVEIVQHIPHLAHSLEELSVRNEIAVKALNGRACEADRRDGNDGRDLLENDVSELLNPR